MASNNTEMAGHRQEPHDASVERYHAFDNLRGILLMLLIVLHSAVAYMVTPFGDVWPFKDHSTHIAFDIVVVLIHTFRLPLLFAMAGFFGAKLYCERGAREFLRNRTQRIAIPLITFWVLLTPFILAPFALIQLEPGSRTPLGLISWLMSQNGLSNLQLFHLWFLFDLLLYYGAMLLMAQLPQPTLIPWVDSSWRRFDQLLQSSWGVLVLVAVTTSSLLPTKLGMLETPATFARPPSTLLADFVFFLFGWWLYHRRHYLWSFASGAWTRVVLGVTFLAIHLACVAWLIKGNSECHVLSAVFASLSTWFFVYGIMGLFARYGNRPSRFWRYVADSSYWCYLVHLPSVVWLQILLANWRVPAVLKFLTVLIATLSVCLLTYDRFVRATPIGALINGRRRPR